MILFIFSLVVVLQLIIVTLFCWYALINNVKRIVCILFLLLLIFLKRSPIQPLIAAVLMTTVKTKTSTTTTTTTTGEGSLAVETLKKGVGGGVRSKGSHTVTAATAAATEITIATFSGIINIRSIIIIIINQLAVGWRRLEQ